MRYLSMLLLLAGCYTPPKSIAPERGPMPITASVDRAWSAVIDVFADRNIPIRTIDRGSGFIATEALRVVQSDTAVTWADCGSGMGQLGPEWATYNVRVRGDSAASTVRITVLWTAAPTLGKQMVDCVTSGRWETQAEKDIKTRAERRTP